jgi:hypothetical protein
MSPITHPMGLFGPQTASPSPTASDAPDMAQRLRADTTGQLRQQLLAQLDAMQIDLRTQAGQGADSGTWEKIEAGLAAVAAAREILTRMPAAAELQPPAGVLPSGPFRSTP